MPLSETQVLSKEGTHIVGNLVRTRPLEVRRHTSCRPPLPWHCAHPSRSPGSTPRLCRVAWTKHRRVA